MSYKAVPIIFYSENKQTKYLVIFYIMHLTKSATLLRETNSCLSQNWGVENVLVVGCGIYYKLVYISGIYYKLPNSSIG